MQRAFVYFAAVTGMATVFVATLIVAGLLFGLGPSSSPGPSAQPTGSAPALPGPPDP